MTSRPFHRTIVVDICVLSLTLVVGIALGNLAAATRRGRRRHQQLQDREKCRQSTTGSKRKARIRKSVESRVAAVSAAAVASPSPGDSAAPVLDNDPHNNGLANNNTSSRRTRKRNKKLTPKDLALDTFTNVARSHIVCMGAGDYQSLLLLPTAAFVEAGCFVPYDVCRDRLVTLGQARAATSGVDQLRILYISCSWVSAGMTQGRWAGEDFETARSFLEHNIDLGYIYIGLSCVASDSKKSERTTQLRHVPLALLRADKLLVLPRPTNTWEEGTPRELQHSDFNFYMRGAWSKMELALAAVGQVKVSVAFRAASCYPESVCELKLGNSDYQMVARQAATALRTAAAVTTIDDEVGAIDGPSLAGTGVDGDDGAVAATSVAAAAAVDAACLNWLGSDLNPLASLEKARVVVAAAEKLGDPSSSSVLLTDIRSMQPTRTELTEDLRVTLGEEHVDGERGLALSLLLFTVLCAQPKERATYTDGFLADTGKMEVVYRPIAVVRSPYRERFGTPRQPQVTTAVLHGGAQEGQLVFLKGKGYEEALQDLSGFEMIWVISHMHLNKGWKGKVRPPRLPEQRKGLFSTRSPHRPNPVALSSMRVTRVDSAEGVIYVQGLDLLDGTPVLDIKPYIGYCDAFPNVKAGWLDALGMDHEEQGDFLQKFSVGAALVHTESARDGSEATSAKDSSQARRGVGGTELYDV